LVIVNLSVANRVVEAIDEDCPTRFSRYVWINGMEMK